MSDDKGQRGAVTRWKCTVCGYIHEGAQPPEICPVCGVGSELFEALEPEQQEPERAPAPERGAGDAGDAGEPQQTVSDVMIATMVNWGVTHVFGMVGHSNLGVADAIRRQAEAGKLTFIGVRHEGAASFAASAYAKLTGKPAACLSIAGPGATNLLTGRTQ